MEKECQTDEQNGDVEKITWQAVVNEIKRAKDQGAKIHQTTNTDSEKLLPAILDRGIIAALTGDDRELRPVRKAVLSRKEEDIRKLDKVWSQYWKELSVQDGCLFKGHKLVIPSQIQAALLKRLHTDHCGAKTMKEKAEYIWFPKLNRRIEATASGCKPYTKTGKNLKPLIPYKDEGTRKTPIEPKEELEIDFAGPLNMKQYLLCGIDRYAKFSFIKIVENTSAKTVIKFLEEIIGIFGIPRRLRSDQGTAFTSRELKEFCERNNIDQIFSPAGDHRGTEQVERLIRTIKERLGALEIEAKGDNNLFQLGIALKKVLWGIRTTSNPETKKIAFRKLFGQET